jgi:sugar phosphate isomerase/epimerase
MDITRVSACTYAMRTNSFSHALRIVAEAGFKKADLWGGMPHFSINDSEYSIDDLIKAERKYNISIANIGTYCGRGFSSDHKDEIDSETRNTFNTIDIAHKLGARSIRIVPGNGERTTIDKIVPYFRMCAEYAELKGVYMGFENHGGEISGNPEVCAELSEKVDSKFFGVLYEPCNLMHAGVDYKKAFETFSQYITHVHIKDGATQHGRNFKATMLGDGEIDVKWVVENLNKSGYAGDFALEYEVTDIEPVETGLIKWFEYYKGLKIED